MSYDIIKRIQITENKVIISAAANNICPRHFYEEECPSLSKILQEQGKDAVELEIFKQYENGNFQRGQNKYVRALCVLRHLPEYEKFSWRKASAEDYDQMRLRRDSKEFDELLSFALKKRLPRDKFIVTKPYNGRTVYLAKLTKRFATWTSDIARAKTFHYHEDAEDLKSCFEHADEWRTVRLNSDSV